MSNAAKTPGLTFAKLLFRLGQLYITLGAVEALSDSGQQAAEFLNRHRQGDWGEVNEEVKVENDFSVDKELRILTAYRTRKGDKSWVITEADRSATTLLLPSKY